ncbi:MAG: hypothetical protein JNL97_16040 [Verrucomicrobiales bacterium]|nr:hypothetical protein [Verrucomicrobiales bacterium]
MKFLPHLSGILLVLSLVGCSSDPKSEADPAALESAFKEAGETIQNPAPTEESTTDTVVIPISPAGEVPIKEVASRAAAAMRKDEVQEALVLLQTLRRARNISPEQLTAVQDQMAALQSDLAAKAQAGDPKAKQALQLIQQSTRW